MTRDLRKELSVPPERLYRSVDPGSLPFDTTEKVQPLEGTIGQPRAIEAIRMGAEVKTPGYNVFVAGIEGSGRETAVNDAVIRYAREQATPPDWVYVHNFENPDVPNAIHLPPGLGQRFAKDMDEFIQSAKREIPKAFESENYEKRKRETLTPFYQKRRRMMEDLTDHAKALDVVLEFTPHGVVSVPLLKGRPIHTEAFEGLPQGEKQEIESRTRKVQARAATVLRETRELDKQEEEELRKLDREIARVALWAAFDELNQKYREFEGVSKFLAKAQENLLDHLGDFRTLMGGEGEGPQDLADMLLSRAGQRTKEDLFLRYRVNVLVNNGSTRGAPVIFERNPTYYNLFGKISYRGTFGAMVTDLLQIGGGALHRANGGYLVLDALEVLRSPFSWEALKRSLRARKIQIENLGEHLTAVPIATLRPEPIPVEVKLILIGAPTIYQLLFHLDPEFQTLFKIKADFSPDMSWTPENVNGYAAFLRRCVQENGLRHFDRSAIARMVEYGGRIRENQRKLSTRLMEISDLAAEASFWAGKSGHELVSGEDVEIALHKKEFRSNLVETRVQEAIAEGVLMINTEESRLGQVNGLSVLDIGDYTFGKPTRVTASIGLGKGSVRSIDRETKLSGPIHSKGFLILSGYLRNKYVQEWPLSLGATITFEQTYDEVEGDSASSTELYALLSALSGVPVAQGIAVTGSVNQQGEVQAVGGVNEKIEGFFAICQARGLTGGQGVIIPKANTEHLMLKEAIRKAVREGRFHIWAVKSVDEGICILTGLPAGEARPDGSYEEGTIHYLVENRLRYYAQQLRKFAASAKEEASGVPPFLRVLKKSG